MSLLLALLLEPAPACQICLPFPKKSAADGLIEADAVVLARENPQKPFSLIALEVLKGEVEDKEIDLFLDSQSRRTLASYTDRTVVCVYRKEGVDAGWQRLGMTDDAGVYEPVIREVIDLSARWEQEPPLRPKFFSKLLGHQDPQLRQLAHLEVARAPYDEIRAFGNELPPEQIRAFLDDFRYVEWHALYILLLAQSGSEQDRERIREAMRGAEKFGLTNQLAAWATAWIEIGEGEALRFIEDCYLRKPDRKPDELKAITSALSVHGSRGHTHLLDRIVRGYRILLETHPSMASLIVDDLTKWERWDFANEVGEIVNSDETDFDLQSSFKLRAYVDNAAQRSTDETASGRRVPLEVLLLAGGCLIILPIWLAVRRKNHA